VSAPELRNHHAGLGATFATLGGAEVVVRYGDPSEETLTARRGVGLLDRSYVSVVAVTGEDRLSFLDGLLTNDAKRLAPGAGFYAATLDAKSRVVGDVRVLAFEDRYLLLLEPESREAVLAHFDKYLISDDVELTPVPDRRIFGVYGPRARTLFAALAEGTPPEAHHHHAPLSLAGLPCDVVATPMTGGEGFEVLCEADAADRIWQSLNWKGEGFLRPIGVEAFDLLRFEAGWPKYGVDVDATVLALEARLPDALRFDKGCYVGQEAVARATYRGRLRRHRVGLVVAGDAPLAADTPLHAGDEEAGRVTSSVRSPTLGRVIAQAYVRTDHAEPGAELLAKDREARVVAFPFVAI
jgi:folate-binding protein YgfZ